MKLIVIGMDGVSAETFRRGWTPFLEEMIAGGQSLRLTEDLLSRGWSEIITGEHALVTGALYERPVMNGGYDWTESYKLGDVPGLGTEIKPIWQVLGERGLRIGMMNVPTTFPAPAVDGFFVSGGGGGGPLTQDPVAELCHPPEILGDLLDMGYIVDERGGSLLDEKKLYAPAAFFGRLAEKTERRTAAFIELARKHAVDFGFVVYRSTIMTEVVAAPEIEKRRLGMGSANGEIIDAAEGLYRALDGQVARLVDAFAGARVLLVSDHGTAVRKAMVNPNVFLVEAGLQAASAARQGALGFIKSYKHLVPYRLRQRLKKSKAVRRSYESMIPFNPQKTQAFCMAFSTGAHGIYVNDRVRFGGPVAPEEAGAVADRITTAFNAHPLAQAHGLAARQKPAGGTGRPAAQFPDVVLDLPDGFRTAVRARNFVEVTGLPPERLDLEAFGRDLRLTGKGHTPLAVAVGHAWQAGEGPADLTAVYRHVTSVLEQ